MPAERTISTINPWGSEEGDRPPICFSQATAPSPWASPLGELSSATRRLAPLQEVKGSFSFPELPYVLSWCRYFKGLWSGHRALLVHVPLDQFLKTTPHTPHTHPMAILGILTVLFAIWDTYFGLGLSMSSKQKTNVQLLSFKSVSETAA